MPDFKEDLLQFVWQNKLLKAAPLVTVSGQNISVIKTGNLNPDAGPDFFNACIQIDGLELIGNIEIHLKTSDWLKHGHQFNKAYDRLILHVVYQHDIDLPQNLENNVEVLELKSLIDSNTIENYRRLTLATNKLPCTGQLKHVSDFKFVAWLERMAIERLEEKVARFENLFKQSNGDFAQVFYVTLLRNFGFKVNAIPFELLARQLPFRILLKHADNSLQIESLLFGMSGLLDDQFKDKYIQTLQNEFEFWKTKYGLKPLQKEIFKFSKLRPANFPTVRLAQFAALIQTNSSAISSPHKFNEYENLVKILSLTPGSYWQNRFVPDGEVKGKKLAMGKASAEIVIINTFAPFFYFYGKKTDQPVFMDKALELFSKCNFEVNTKTRLFDEKKENLKSAAASQAIINLVEHYCGKKQCLKCGIATAILKPELNALV